MTNKRYVNIRVASEYTSIPVKSLYELSSLGKVPSIKLGRRILFDMHDIDELMASMKRAFNKDEEIINNIVGEVHGGWL